MLTLFITAKAYHTSLSVFEVQVVMVQVMYRKLWDVNSSKNQYNHSKLH
jgi:hypothetical protein